MSFLRIDGMGNIEGQGTRLVSPEEEMAAQFASFGAYSYQNQQQMNPGGYGYNEPSSFYYNPMYQQPTVYKPYNMTQAGWSGGLGAPYNAPNPAFGFMAQQGYNPQQQQVIKQPDITYDIKPYNPFCTPEFLPPTDWNSKLDKLRYDYFIEVETADVERELRSNLTYNYNIDNTYNYYNQPYYSMWYRNTSAIDKRYIDDLNKMEEEAKQARININKNLVTLAYNYLGKEYDPERIDELFSPKTVTIPGSEIIEDRNASMLDNLVPFDNSQWYRDMNAKITMEYRKYIPKDADLATTFDNMGLVWLDWEMEDYKHKVNLTAKRSTYDGNTYMSLIKNKLRNDYMKEHNIVQHDNESIEDAIVRELKSDNDGDEIDTFSKELKNRLLTCGEFPTLQQSAKMNPDGTMTISYETFKNNQSNVNNNEDFFESCREQFNAFLDSIPKAINTNMTNDERAKEYEKQKKIEDTSFKMQNGIPVEDDNDVGTVARYVLEG